jgi:hypothetical protein
VLSCVGGWQAITLARARAGELTQPASFGAIFKEHPHQHRLLHLLLLPGLRRGGGRRHTHVRVRPDKKNGGSVIKGVAGSGDAGCVRSLGSQPGSAIPATDLALKQAVSLD